MTRSKPRVGTPHSPYGDCDDKIAKNPEPKVSLKSLCTDVQSGTIIRSPSIVPGLDGDFLGAEIGHAIQIVGGAYRLVSIAVDIDTRDLARRTRRISAELRMHKRLWRRKRRPRPQLAR